MRRLAAGIATVTLMSGLIAAGAAPASAAAPLKPRAATPKSLGFGAEWSVVLSSKKCDPGSTATTCRSGLWIRPAKVGRPTEFNQNVSYEAAVYRSKKAARRAVVSRVAGIEALAPPADPAAYGSLVVRRKTVAGTQRVTVSYVFLGPEQRERLYVAQKGRRMVAVGLGSATPLGLLPAGPKQSVLWRKLASLVR